MTRTQTSKCRETRQCKHKLQPSPPPALFKCVLHVTQALRSFSASACDITQVYHLGFLPLTPLSQRRRRYQKIPSITGPATEKWTLALKILLSNKVEFPLISKIFKKKKRSTWPLTTALPPHGLRPWALQTLQLVVAEFKLLTRVTRLLGSMWRADVRPPALVLH